MDTDGKLFFWSYPLAFKAKIMYGCQDLLTGELAAGKFARITDMPVITFCLTDDKIFYSPMVLRHMYIPEDYGEHPENVVIFLADATLYECGLDGGNSRTVYTNDKSDYIEAYTVIDGVFYGWIQDFDDADHTWVKRYFAEINLKSGEITHAEIKYL